MAHLRGLRGLFDAARSECPGTYREDARKALVHAQSKSAEFSSLSRDAIRTWRAEQSRLDVDPHAAHYHWLDLYNRQMEPLDSYVPERGSLGDVVTDDSLFYFIPAYSSRDPNKIRQVKFRAQDKLLDGSDGHYFRIDEADRNLATTYFDSEKGRALTLGELIDGKRWFRDTTVVTVEGKFAETIKLI